MLSVGPLCYSRLQFASLRVLIHFFFISSSLSDYLTVMCPLHGRRVAWCPCIILTMGTRGYFGANDWRDGDITACDWLSCGLECPMSGPLFLIRGPAWWVISSVQGHGDTMTSLPANSKISFHFFSISLIIVVFHIYVIAVFLIIVSHFMLNIISLSSLFLFNSPQVIISLAYHFSSLICVSLV